MCVGNTCRLTNATAGGDWIIHPAGIASIDNSGLLTGIQPGKATVYYKVSNNAGCTDSASLNITVNDLPQLSIDGPIKVCLNSTNQYSALTQNNIQMAWQTDNGEIITGKNSNYRNNKLAQAGFGKIKSYSL